MIIKSIYLQNYKSFKKTFVELEKFNVLLGNNSTGKSNFLSVFSFLDLVIRFSTRSAILSTYGGSEFFPNINIDPTKMNTIIKLDILTDYNVSYSNKKYDKKFEVNINKTEYELEVEFSKNRKEFNIVKDLVTQSFQIFDRKNKIQLLSGSLSMRNDSGKGLKIEGMDVTDANFKDMIPLPKEEYFIEEFLKQLFSKKSKKSKIVYPILDSRYLSYSSCIYDVLSEVLKNKERRRKFRNILGDLLNNSNIADNVVKLFAKKHDEQDNTYYDDEYRKNTVISQLQSFSDGTISAIVLIIALVFNKNPLILIRDIEKNIYPYNISSIMDLVQDVLVHDKRKQIFVNTNSPLVIDSEVVKPENVLMFKTNKDGFTTIEKLDQKEEFIKDFLNGDLTLFDYIQMNRF